MQEYHNDELLLLFTHQYQDTNEIGFTEVAFSEVEVAAFNRGHRLIFKMAARIIGSIWRQNL